MTRLFGFITLSSGIRSSRSVSALKALRKAAAFLRHFLLVSGIALFLQANSAHAAVIVPNTKIASGTITSGATMILINSPHSSELPLGTVGAKGPNWTDNSADGWRQTAQGTVDSGTQGNSPWETDGTVSPQGQLRFYNSGTSIGQTYTFNLADSGIDLPDGSIINGIYASWTTRNTSGAIYSYTEGVPTGSVTVSHATAPTVNLALNWTNSLSVVQTANFQRIFSTPITVTGGNGFTLNIRKNGNTHQTDAIFLDVTLVPEPSSALLGGLGVLALLRRRR